MSAGRLIVALLLALAIETAVFHLAHRDLMWLRHPVAELQAAPHEAVAGQVAAVLTREQLTRGQLEALAAATAGRPTLRAEYVQVMERLQQMAPDDPQIQLRLADAYRLVGRLDAARSLFEQVLAEGGR